MCFYPPPRWGTSKVTCPSTVRSRSSLMMIKQFICILVDIATLVVIRNGEYTGNRWVSPQSCLHLSRCCYSISYHMEKQGMHRLYRVGEDVKDPNGSDKSRVLSKHRAGFPPALAYQGFAVRIHACCSVPFPYQKHQSRVCRTRPWQASDSAPETGIWLDRLACLAL